MVTRNSTRTRARVRNSPRRHGPAGESVCSRLTWELKQVKDRLGFIGEAVDVAIDVLEAQAADLDVADSLRCMVRDALAMPIATIDAVVRELEGKSVAGASSRDPRSRPQSLQ